tara:strand:- start:502 stop:897 length:396 start_codon:yes stop_codon:yes gene_type:complete
MQKNKASKSQWLMVATCLVTFSIFMWWWNDTEPIEDNTEYWIPTEEDKKYIDSLYNIVKATESDIDTISQDVERIIRKLDIIIYDNGESDSIKLYDKQHAENYDKHMMTIEQSHDYDIPLMNQYYKRDSID